MTDTGRPDGKSRPGALMVTVLLASTLSAWLLDLGLGLAVNGVAPALRVDFVAIGLAMALVAPALVSANGGLPWPVRLGTAGLVLAVPSLLWSGVWRLTVENSAPWLTLWAIAGLVTAWLVRRVGLTPEA